MEESVSSVVLGTTSSVAGVTILPDTGSNPVLLALSLLSIVAGCLILGSFVFARIVNLMYRSR